VALADLVILAVDAPEIAVPEEDVADTPGADKQGFLPEVGRRSGDDRQGTRVASGNLAAETVVAAVMRAEDARLQHRGERLRPPAKLAGGVQHRI
jgi:hypothetical protein